MSCKGGQSPPFTGKYESTLCEGDFDHDGDVDGSDLAIFAEDFGRTDCPCWKKVR
ncbi:hypothetical protein DMNBHIDG_00770 [Candidatus Methanoperedenaceae archaeon GB37]|nr:hypothetical protein DMNBHIDG_00770 [Candidatus Methanoperedenaceae archaeon GB37]